MAGKAMTDENYGDAWRSLSRRDIQFIGELQAGRTDREIAERLGTSAKEVGAKIKAICNKVGVRDRTELVKRWKARNGLDTEAQGE